MNYCRGSAFYPLHATKVNSKIETQTNEGFIVESEVVDFIFRLCEIEAIGEPEFGDKVVMMVNNVQVTYEVWAPSGMSVFKKDVYEKSIRVHTQLVKT